MSDRRVHGFTADGGKIVRYDRAGKWYIEWADRPRRAVTVRQAAELAAVGGVALDLPGGGRFDALVRKATDAC